MSIGRQRIVRRCRKCLHTESEQLPVCRKAVVYLDQFVYSNMAKVVDDVWAAERAAPEVWARLFDALDTTLKLQLVVCPQSRLHEQESIVHKHFAMLRRLYEHFSCGTRFEFPTRVHGLQLSHALEAHLAGSAPNFDVIDRRAVIAGEPDDWQQRIQITLNWTAALPDAAKHRSAREKSGEIWARLFEGWRRNPQTFDEHYRRELKGHAETTVRLLGEHLAVMEQLNNPTEGALAHLVEDAVNYRLEVQNAYDLAAQAIGAGVTPAEALTFVAKFLYSDIASSAPMNELNALLFAALGRRAANGQKKPPSRGMWQDFEAISAFLPYCDAMFVDNECAGLIAEEPLRSRTSAFSSKIFSTRTVEAFIAYLHSLEAAAGEPWRELVVRTYGPDWLTPYRNILRDQRNREQRRKLE